MPAPCHKYKRNIPIPIIYFTGNAITTMLTSTTAVATTTTSTMATTTKTSNAIWGGIS